MEPLDNMFSARLREERLRLRLNQQELADVGGVSKGSQVGYESGVRAPDLRYLERVARANVDIMYVVTGRPIASAASEHFDWQLHNKILETVESWLDEKQLTLPFPKKMDLLRLFMSNYTSADSVDPQFIFQTLRLVA